MRYSNYKSLSLNMGKLNENIKCNAQWGISRYISTYLSWSLVLPRVLLKQAKVSVASFFDHRLESRSKFQGRQESGRKAGRNAGVTIVIPLCGRNRREFGGRICRELSLSGIRTDFHHGQATCRTRRQARWGRRGGRFCREEAAPAATEAHVKCNA